MSTAIIFITVKTSIACLLIFPNNFKEIAYIKKVSENQIRFQTTFYISHLNKKQSLTSIRLSHFQCLLDVYGNNPRYAFFLHGYADQLLRHFHGQAVVGDVEELGLRRHFFDQVAKTRGVGIVQRSVDFVQKAERSGVEAEQGEHEAHGGEGFFAAGEEVDGAVFLAGRTRHDGHAGGQEVVAYHFEGGLATAEQGGEEGLDFAVDGVEGFFETRFGFVVRFGRWLLPKG